MVAVSGGNKNGVADFCLCLGRFKGVMSNLLKRQVNLVCKAAPGRVGTAKHFEGVEPESCGFVLDAYVFQARPGCKARQSAQRRGFAFFERSVKGSYGFSNRRGQRRRVPACAGNF